MTMLVASLLFVPLLAISLAHLLWSFGLTWPIRNSELLAQTVIGTADAARLPKRRAFLVAIVTLVAGLVALSLADDTAGGIGLTLAAIPAAAIFLWRGAVSYTPAWRATHAQPAFAFSDRRVYAPVCMFVGAGFLLLMVLRLS